MASTHKSKHLYPWRGRILLLVVFLLLLYLVVPQLESFSNSLAVLRQARWDKIVLAVAMVVATYVLAACIYQLLAVKPLRFSRTLMVQGANGFANRMLPAGIGGMALNVRYLQYAGHRLPQALAVVGANNILGFLGHMCMLVVAVLAGGASFLGNRIAGMHIGYGWYVALVLVVCLGLLLFAVRSFRKRVGALLQGVLQVVVSYKKRLRRLLVAFACSLLLTLLYASVFYMSAAAVGIAMSPLQVFVVFTVGLVVGAATPTPGGLGGVEAGLMAGLVIYGQDASTALAGALLYRLLSYWLPLILGVGLFISIRRVVYGRP